MRRAPLALLLVLSFPLVPSTSHAAPTTADVEKLIRKGSDLRRQGKDQEALPLFQKAYETAATARTAAQLGLCEMQLGYWLASEGHLTEALAGHTDAWLAKYRPTLEESLGKVKAQIGEVVVTGTPTSGEVSINGRPASEGRLPLGPIHVVAGMVSVTLHSAGYLDKITTVTVPAKTQVKVSLELDKVAPPPESPGAPEAAVHATEPAKTDEGWPAAKIAGASMIGAGALAVGGGITLLLFDKRQSCDSPVPGGMCQERTSTRLPGWGLIGLGAAVGVAGGVLLYTSSSGAQVALSGSPSSIALSGRF